MYLLQSFTSSCTATWLQLPGASSKLLAVVLAVLPGGLSIMPTVLDICPCSTLWQIPPTQLGATWPHRACGITLLVSSSEDICQQTLMPSTCLWPPGKCIGLYFTWSCTPHSIGTHTHPHTNTHTHSHSYLLSFPQWCHHAWLLFHNVCTSWLCRKLQVCLGWNFSGRLPMHHVQPIGKLLSSCWCCCQLDG